MIEETLHSNTQDALVVFTPSGRRGRFAVGTPLLQAARSLGVDIDSVCGGRGLCGRCQILCVEGDFPKHGIHSSAASLSAFTATEERFERVKKRSLDGRRLSCHTMLQGDVVVDVPPDSQVHRQVVRKDAEVLDIELDANIRLHYIEVQEADMHDPSGDLRRVKLALEQEWGLKHLGADLNLLPILQKTLRKSDWKVTVAVENESQIIAIWPGLKERIFGLAVDVGSTTVAAHLCDLASGEVVSSAGIMNPQIRFGEDLMSRVSYVMMHPGGEVEMTKVVRQALNTLLLKITKDADIGIGIEDVLSFTFVANPVMHHLLLGIDPIELGGAPFALAVDEAINCFAREMALDAHPNARVYLLPCIAGHVGADTAGMMLAEMPQRFKKVTLLVDVGTNAEIVLGNKRRMLACSSPTGPAFEGAQISGGQRAAPGAVERVRIDPETLEPRFSIIGCEHWSDQPEFAQKNPVVTGICGSGIIEIVAEMYLSGIINQDGVIDPAMANISARVYQDGRTYSYLLHDGEVRIAITQTDVRQIQLAKAALYAGVKLLMDHMGVQRVDRIRLAGAFGSHIDVKYAMVLGLIPDCKLAHVSSAGNAAGSGARIALLDKKSRTVIEDIVRKIEKIETALEPRFQELFVDAMAFPNKTDSFPELAKAVTLPPIKEVHLGGGDKRGRRRRRS